jgi:hypothetical protein
MNTKTNAFAALTANLPAEDQTLFTGMIDDNLINGNEEGVVKALAQLVAADILKNAVDNQSGDDPATFDTSLDDCVLPRLKGLLANVSAEVTKILPEVIEYAVQNFKLIKSAKDLKIEAGLVLYISSMSVGTATIEKEYEPGHFTVAVKWEDGSKNDDFDMSEQEIRDLIIEGRFHIEKPEPIQMPKVSLIRINMVAGNVVTFNDGATLTIDDADLNAKTFNGKAHVVGEEEKTVEAAGIDYIVGFMQKHGMVTGQSMDHSDCEHCKSEAAADAPAEEAFAATVSGCVDAPATDGYKLNHDAPVEAEAVKG